MCNTYVTLEMACWGKLFNDLAPWLDTEWLGSNLDPEGIDQQSK